MKPTNQRRKALRNIWDDSSEGAETLPKQAPDIPVADKLHSAGSSFRSIGVKEPLPRIFSASASFYLEPSLSLQPSLDNRHQSTASSAASMASSQQSSDQHRPDDSLVEALGRQQLMLANQLLLLELTLSGRALAPPNPSLRVPLSAFLHQGLLPETLLRETQLQGRLQLLQREDRRQSLVGNGGASPELILNQFNPSSLSPLAPNQALERSIQRHSEVAATAESRGTTTARTNSSLAKLPKPRRALTAYNYFFKEERLKLKKEFKSLTFEFMGREISRRWKNLQDRSKYHDLAATEKRRYAQEMAIYNRSKQDVMTQAFAEQRSQLSDDAYQAYLDRVEDASSTRRRR